MNQLDVISIKPKRLVWFFVMSQDYNLFDKLVISVFCLSSMWNSKSIFHKQDIYSKNKLITLTWNIKQDKIKKLTITKTKSVDEVPKWIISS